MRHRSFKMGQFIRAKRTELKISQTDLGRMLGWTSSKGQVISNIERGLQQMPPEYINKLSLILVTPRELILDYYVEDFRESLYKELNK